MVDVDPATYTPALDPVALATRTPSLVGVALATTTPALINYWRSPGTGVTVALTLAVTPAPVDEASCLPDVGPVVIPVMLVVEWPLYDPLTLTPSF